MPAGAFFSSVTAAVLHHLPLPFELERHPALHVAVVSPKRGIASRGVIGHKVQLMGGDVWDVRGLPTSSPERAFCELAGVLSLSDMVAVGDYLIHWRSPLTTPEGLADAVARYPGRRGRRVLVEALSLLNDRAESRRESKLRVVIIRAGITGWEVNYWITVPGKRYRADLAFPRQKVVLEYQGDHHRDPAQWRADMTRISKLEAAGWYVIQFNADDLRDERELAERTRSVLGSRPNRP